MANHESPYALRIGHHDTYLAATFVNSLSNNTQLCSEEMNQTRAQRSIEGNEKEGRDDEHQQQPFSAVLGLLLAYECVYDMRTCKIAAAFAVS